MQILLIIKGTIFGIENKKKMNGFMQAFMMKVLM